MSTAQRSRLRMGFTLLVLSVVGTFAGGVRKADGQSTAITLVHAGQPRAVVVVADVNSTSDRRALGSSRGLLLEAFKRMAGVQLAVVGEAAVADVEIRNGRIVTTTIPGVDYEVSAFILLGAVELAQRLGVTAKQLGPGGIRLKTTGNALVIDGQHDGVAFRGGLIYATVEFLEELGFRYLWPGGLGLVVPATETVRVRELDVAYTPPVKARRIRKAARGPRRYESGLGLLQLDQDLRGVNSADGADFDFPPRTGWGAWNRLGGTFPFFGHAGDGLRGGWDEWGESHPEWFALQADGSRDQRGTGRFRVCLSNRALMEHVANDIIERVNDRPDTILVSLDGNDGGYSSDCLCENCRALDPPDAPLINHLIFERAGSAQRETVQYPSLTDRHLYYWNRIAEIVTEQHPDLLFGVSAYRTHAHPPVERKLHPNLLVRYVPSSPERWQGWVDAGARNMIWRPNLLHNGHERGTLDLHLARQMAHRLQYFAEHGLHATDMDSIYHNWATQGLTYYVAARFSWDPYQDYDELLEDYCQSGFGPAAESIKRYFLDVEALEGGLAAFTPDVVGNLRAHLAQADKAAGDDALIRSRIDFLRTGLELTALTATADALAAAVAEGEDVDKAYARRVLDRRWRLMRHMFKTHPMAVNVAVVEGNNIRQRRNWQRAFDWSGPSDTAQETQPAVTAMDDWWHGDQTDWHD